MLQADRAAQRVPGYGSIISSAVLAPRTFHTATARLSLLVLEKQFSKFDALR